MLKRTLLDIVYARRLHAKRAVSFAGKLLPAPLFRPLRAVAEQVAFRARPEYQGDTLPPIFHYWSQRHFNTRGRRANIASPEQFYFDEIVAAAGQGDAPLRLLSVGSGACALEIALAARLKAAGIGVHVTCVDFNAALLRSAAQSARRNGVGDAMSFLELDCNRQPRFPASDVILVNQFFHHVEDLEGFCASLGDALADAGRLLTSDIIGRNGHLLWPDVEADVQDFWNRLPPAQRVDRYFGTRQQRYRPMDHSAYSNEGIRAQDVVACLSRVFDFEVFFTFGGSIMPFIERRIGFNFDPGAPEDRELIDRIDATDHAALAGGRYPPSNMIAALRKKGLATRRVHEPLSPEQFLRAAAAQQAKVARR
jgi:SAM-dependent methyltransferase